MPKRKPPPPDTITKSEADAILRLLKRGKELEQMAQECADAIALMLGDRGISPDRYAEDQIFGRRTEPASMERFLECTSLVIEGEKVTTADITQ
jgi:hypothetical protein